MESTLNNPKYKDILKHPKPSNKTHGIQNNTKKYRKSQPNQLYYKTENTDYINTHDQIAKYPSDNPMELQSFQDKLQ